MAKVASPSWPSAASSLPSPRTSEEESSCRWNVSGFFPGGMSWKPLRWVWLWASAFELETRQCPSLPTIRFDLSMAGGRRLRTTVCLYYTLRVRLSLAKPWRSRFIRQRRHRCWDAIPCRRRRHLPGVSFSQQESARDSHPSDPVCRRHIQKRWLLGAILRDRYVSGQARRTRGRQAHLTAAGGWIASWNGRLSLSMRI